MLRFLSRDEIIKGDFMPESIKRADKLIVIKSYETQRHSAYEVIDPVSGSKHLVIYKSEKKPPMDWVCDCEWFIQDTLHTGRYCAHILSVHLKEGN